MINLKKTAAAAALAVTVLPSFAAIAINQEGANELTLTVWSASQNASYIQDLGLTLSGFMTNGMSEAGYSFSAAATSLLPTSLSGATDLRWAVTVYDTQGDLNPGTLRLVTTVNNATPLVPKNVGNVALVPFADGTALQNGSATWLSYIGFSNVKGTNPTQANGSAYVTAADGDAYFLGAGHPRGTMNDFLSFQTGNAKNAASKMWFFTSADADFGDTQGEADLFKNSKNTGLWNFNGSTLTYALAPAIAVPEPGTYVLFIAGLAGIGLLVRRRSFGA